MKHALLVGGATGREHGIAKHFYSNEDYILSAILWADNQYVKRLCQGSYSVMELTDVDAVFEEIRSVSPDFVIIGQGEVIQRGLKDMLRNVGIPCIAPTYESAKIEGSKTYLRNLLQKIDPELNPKYRDFYEYSSEVEEYINSFDNKVVVKCDGVISGPRVRLYDLPSQATEATENAKMWLENYGHIIVEEYIDGEEIAIMSFTDGVHLVHTFPFKNHKRINEGNVGENTSGMGTVAGKDCFSYMTQRVKEKIYGITERILQECNKVSDDKYTGSLYGEFLVCGDRIKVIEYNCRFGNPSFINMLQLMNVDFPCLCEHILDGTIDELHDVWKDKISISVYVVPKDYTISKEYVKTEVDFSDVSEDMLFVGNMSYKGDKFFLKNSRAFAVCAIGDTIEEVRHTVYSELEKIKGNIYYRKDIGIWGIK